MRKWRKRELRVKEEKKTSEEDAQEFELLWG
jgi:hypothetical protein